MYFRRRARGGARRRDGSARYEVGRPYGWPPDGLTIAAAERLAEQVAEAQGDEQCTPGVLPDLMLDIGLEIAVTEPVGRFVHAAGDRVLHPGALVGRHGY